MTDIFEERRKRKKKTAVARKKKREKVAEKVSRMGLLKELKK